jgi:hypothetical protein
MVPPEPELHFRLRDLTWRGWLLLAFQLAVFGLVYTAIFYPRSLFH